MSAIWARLPPSPLVLRRTLVAEHALLEAERREHHAVGERLAQEKAAVAVLKRQLAHEVEDRRDAQSELVVARARGDRHFEGAEHLVAANNAALGLRPKPERPADELPPRPEPTVSRTANKRRLRDVSRPIASTPVSPIGPGPIPPAPGPVGDHPPRPA